MTALDELVGHWFRLVRVAPSSRRVRGVRSEKGPRGDKGGACLWFSLILGHADGRKRRAGKVGVLVSSARTPFVPLFDTETTCVAAWQRRLAACGAST